MKSVDETKEKFVERSVFPSIFSFFVIIIMRQYGGYEECLTEQYRRATVI